VPWGLLLALACLVSVVLMTVMKRRPRSPASLRLFFAIRVVLLVAVVVLFYLTFFHHAAA
jgi:drug/metabolite transporter (DMT)-like permease